MDLLEMKEMVSAGVDISHWYYASKYKLLYTFVKRRVGHLDNVTILDIGTGSSIFLKKLANDFVKPSWKFIGLDINFEIAEQKDLCDDRITYKKEIQKGESFDVVILMDVLEHIHNDAQFFQQFFGMIYGDAISCRPFIHFFITVPAHMWLWSSHDKVLKHYRRYTLESLEATLPDELRISQRYYYFASLLPVAIMERVPRRFSSGTRTNIKKASNWLNTFMTRLLGAERKFAFANSFGGLTAVVEGFARTIQSVTVSKELKSLFVIPAYNEASRLPDFIDEVCAFLSVQNNAYVVVIDDGSLPDESRQMEAKVEQMRSKFPDLNEERVSFVRQQINSGKGATLRNAFHKAILSGKYDCIGFVDADGATPFQEAYRLVHALESDRSLDVAIGSRVALLGNKVVRKWYRHITGRIFATILSWLFQVPVYDSQCGAKVFRTHTLTPDILNLCKNNTWLFDTQLVVALWKSGVRMREVPVRWREIPGSKVSVIRDAARMFLGCWKFRKPLRRFLKMHKL